MTSIIRQKSLTLTERHEIVLRLDMGHPLTAIAKDYGVKKQAVSYIKGQADKIKKAANYCKVPRSSKSLNTSQTFCVADDLMFTWFSNMRSQKKLINGSLMLATFKKILTWMEKEVPTDIACVSWIQRWRNRRGINFKGAHGENIYCPDYSGWLKNIQPVIAQYAPENMFNADETALFYRMQSGKTFTLLGEQVKGGKCDKARVTILVGASSRGDKLPLLCIGKSKQPCWPVVMGKRAQAPISYDSSKKGWWGQSGAAG